MNENRELAINIPNPHKPIDGLGNKLKRKDRVYTYDFGWVKVFGTLHHGQMKEKYRPKNIHGCWYVKWDDGEEFVVLDFKGIWKVK